MKDNANPLLTRIVITSYYQLVNHQPNKDRNMKLQLTYHFEGEDELRAHLAAGDTRSAEQAGALAKLAGSTAAPVVAEEPGVAADRSAVDGDGMPYDAAVHSDPPTFTSKGLWKAQRGKADAAEAARAAFKARGGPIAAPAPVVLAAPVTAPAALAMPGMPVAPTPAPVPVTIEQVYEATAAATARGIIPDRIVAIYGQIGLTEMAQFDTNESIRAAYVSAVNALV